jgi:hypothetical protein
MMMNKLFSAWKIELKFVISIQIFSAQLDFYENVEGYFHIWRFLETADGNHIKKGRF